MIEKKCNLWIEPAEYRCIPTSGAVRDGSAVLFPGVAQEAARKYEGMGEDLARLITSRGNHVHMIRPGLVSFPVKQYEWAAPNLDFIGRSARELKELVGTAKTLLPRPGCGPGELAWEEVAKVLADLPDNIIVIQHV